MSSFLIGRYGTVAAVPAPTAWYDASNAASITSSGGAVSQWSDISGNGFHLTQGTGAAKPTTGTRTQGGVNVLDFDGGDVLSGSSLNIGMTNITIFTVFAEDTAVADAGVVGLHNGAGDSWNRTDSLAIETGASTQHFAYVQAGIGVGFSVAPGGVSPASVKSVRKTVTAVKVYSAVTGTSTSTSGIITATGTANGGIVVGGYYLAGAVAATNRLDGWIAEIRIFNSALTDGEVTTIEAALVAKWGL